MRVLSVDRDVDVVLVGLMCFVVSVDGVSLLVLMEFRC